MSNTVTILLEKWRNGNQEALSDLVTIVYDELRRLASHYLRGERNSHSLEPTALINEAFIRLIQDDTNFANRAHFMAVAANTMRRVLVDYARKKNAQKREGDVFHVTLTGLSKSIMSQDIDILALHEALNKLETIDSIQMKIVELRFFCGLTIEETAVVLDISASTVKSEWTLAKAWLYRELG